MTQVSTSPLIGGQDQYVQVFMVITYTVILSYPCIVTNFKHCFWNIQWCTNHCHNQIVYLIETYSPCGQQVLYRVSLFTVHICYTESIVYMCRLVIVGISRLSSILYSKIHQRANKCRTQTGAVTICWIWDTSKYGNTAAAGQSSIPLGQVGCEGVVVSACLGCWHCWTEKLWLC